MQNANDLSNTIKKCIGKGFTFIWDSYVHKFEPLTGVKWRDFYQLRLIGPNVI